MDRADKPKVTDEVWDDARVRGFLQQTPLHGPDSDDYRLLLRAYQSMRPGDFERFLEMYQADGHDIDARDRHGRNLSSYIASHRHSGPFVALLSKAGATPPVAA